MAASTRGVKSISATLKEVRDSHRFLKITEKNGSYTATRVQISGYKTAWAKNPNVVYSPKTGLSGVPSEVIDYLKSRGDRNDDSAEDVISQFKKDDHITFKNHEKHMDYITDLSRDRAKVVRDNITGAPKINLIPREEIADLLARVQEVRKHSGSGSKSTKTKIIQEYLDTIRGTDKVFRVHGCDPSGMLGGQKLRTASRKDISSKSTIYLGSSGDLNHFCIPASYDEKRYVVNFMTLYYMHTEGMKQSDATVKARTFADDLLAQYKKVRGRKVSQTRGRSSSTRSRSGSRSSSDRRSKSTVTRKTSATPSKSPTRTPSKSPAKSPIRAKSPVRSDSPKQTASTVQSAGSSRVKSPPRSTIPRGATSPPATQAGKTRRFQLPTRNSEK